MPFFTLFLVQSGAAGWKHPGCASTQWRCSLFYPEFRLCAWETLGSLLGPSMEMFFGYVEGFPALEAVRSQRMLWQGLSSRFPALRQAECGRDKPKTAGVKKKFKIKFLVMHMRPFDL